MHSFESASENRAGRGTQQDGWGDEGSGVGMRGAFDTQKTYARMPAFLRDW